MMTCGIVTLLVLLTHRLGCQALFQVRKCCPPTEHLDEGLDCVPSILPEEYLPGFNHSGSFAEMWPWWFPNSSLLIKLDSSGELLSGFPKDSVVMEGVSEPCCETESTFLVSSHVRFDFFEDGSIQVYNFSLQRQIKKYPPNSFCVDRLFGYTFRRADGDPEYVVKLCPCGTTPCIYKCCPFDMFLNIMPSNVKDSVECRRGLGNCTSSDDNYTSGNVLFFRNSGLCLYVSDVSSTMMPLEAADLCAEIPFHRILSNTVSEWQPEGINDFYILHGFPQCLNGDETFVTELSDRQKYRFQENGTLSLGPLGVSSQFKFCGDFGGSSYKTDSTYVISCYSRSERLLYEKWTRMLYGSLAAIGALFLGLTLCVYAMLTRELTVNDKNLIAQTWSLLIGYTSIAIFHFFRDNMPHSICVFLGFVILYAFLASFFWLNVLCIDLAWAFSEMRLIRNMKVWQNRRRFLQYSVYAWLSPAFIVLITIIIDFTPGIPDFILKPEFVSKCFFPNDSMAKLAYFYGPMAVLLLINLFLFLFTAYKIRSAQQQASSLLKNHHRNEKQRVILYLKLFSLMGLSWFFELLSWAVGGPDYYWYSTDIVNLFRAVFIFITLCCKKQVLDELRDKFKIDAPQGRQTASNSVVTLASNLGSEPVNSRYSNVASSSL